MKSLKLYLQSPAKRRRLEDPLGLLTPSGRQSLPAKLLNIPKASLASPIEVPAVGTGPARATPVIVDPLRSMHIPSGITVTKHQKNVLTTNGNLTISLAESNNNTTSFNNNVTPKQIKIGTGQKVAWSVSNKAPSPNAVITTVPSHQVRVTPCNQIRLAPGSKIIPASKAMPAKIQPVLGIGQPQQQSQAQQPKAIILGVTKPKTAVGQMGPQQPQKALSLQVHQKLVAGQQQHIATLGQLQQIQVQQQQPLRPVGIRLQQPQKPIGVQLATQQSKPLAGQLAAQQPKPLGGQSSTQQKPLGAQLLTQQKPAVGSLQQPAKQNTAIGVQIQQIPKVFVGQPQQKVFLGQLQQQQQNTFLGQLQQEQQKKILGQLQQEQHKMLLGQLQKQQQQHKKIVGQSPQEKVPLGQLQPQQKPPQPLTNPLVQLKQQQPPPHQQKTSVSQQQQKTSVGQSQQQQKNSLVQIQQQPQLQQKTSVSQQPQKTSAGQIQLQPHELQKTPVGQNQQQKQQQKNSLVQLQEQPQVQQKTPVSQQPEKISVGQIQQQPQQLQKTSVGQNQQQQKNSLVQLQQQPQLQQKTSVSQQQQKNLSGQLQQQPKTLAVQLHQQQKASVWQLQQQPQQQPKTLQLQQQPQQQTKTLPGQVQQQPQLLQKTSVGQLQQQPRTSVGQLQQQQKTSIQQQKTSVSQQQQKTSVGQFQQHQTTPKAATGHQATPEKLQQQRTAPGQQQKLPIGQPQSQQKTNVGLQQQQVAQKKNVGPIQHLLKNPLAKPQLPKTSVGLPRQQPLPQNPLLVAQQQSPKTQLAIQLLNSVMGTQIPPQQPSLPVVNQITHKSVTIQRLPMMQTPPTGQKILPKQITPQQTPPPAHIVQKQTMPNAAMENPPFAHRPPIVRPMTVAKITPVPTNSKVCYPIKPQVARAVSPTAATMTAARTLPFRSSQHKTSASPMTSTHVQGFTASATPPQRLLATPPHCAAALNEPLLLNLPPTTSITPQLTPTTTPPPAGPSAGLQQQQLAKAAAFKLNSLPGASISPVIRTPTASVKRIQPITVLKKSDEEWRRHLEQQQKHRVPLQSSSAPTIVLVESPPTTPPTDKPETEAKEAGDQGGVNESSINPIPTDKKPRSMKRPAVVIAPPNKSVPVITEIVDLDAIPENPPEKRRKESYTPIMNAIEASPAANAPFTTEYAALLRLCREVDKSDFMESLVRGKLTQYYYSVPESFVMSCGFRKLVTVAMSRIRNESNLVYVHLKYVVDELAARMVANMFPTIRATPSAMQFPLPRSFTPKQPEMFKSPEQTGMMGKEQDDDVEEVTVVHCEPVSREDKRREERIRHLNRTLHAITKRIKMLDDAEVDLNDEDSSYLQVERFKKRACQIYEKICDLTGESKSVRRQLKKPIQFKDTDYPHFNRKLSAFVNKLHEFPDYHDVLQILEQCNKEKELGLAKFEMKRIAYDAFNKVGRMLQSRRKNDLYETVTHFTANGKDPASSDPELLAKLKENNKKQTKISDVLEKYALEQDLNAEERQEARLKEKKLKQVKADEEAAKLAALAQDDDEPCTSAQAAAKAAALASLKKSPAARGKVIGKRRPINGRTFNIDDDGDDSEEESDTEDDDVEEFVNNFQANGDVSDTDSEVEAVTSPKRDALPLAEEDVIDITRDETGKKNDEATPNGRLKIMSVSSLNANFVHGQDPHRNPYPIPSAKPVIADQIIISDEES
ncbi:daxx-like protein isoform X2 [Drosophila yakuba]|uniref:daxx-like protein isoform X2 n=1 Tax=Drosophila yakuba TaxID=7245 RepID=UPI0019307EF1|nr:daxx-like protein isoform X2 [Drosophila yakuba]